MNSQRWSYGGVNFIMINLVYNQSSCSKVGRFLDGTKPVHLKKIRKIWQAWIEYNESNTLLIDDSPYKALCNPICINSLF